MADERGFESQDERRNYDRARLIVDVFFDGKDVTGVASTKDISPGGLYMNTQAEIPEGTLLTVYENPADSPSGESFTRGAYRTQASRRQ